MSKLKENKEFILRYFESMSGKPKSDDACRKWTSDEQLIGHIAFFESIFPRYEIYADEMTAEGDRVVVRARMRGTHSGPFQNIPPTGKIVEMPFSICYTIKDGLITHHWLIADQALLMQQLGVES